MELLFTLVAELLGALLLFAVIPVGLVSVALGEVVLSIALSLLRLPSLFRRAAPTPARPRFLWLRPLGRILLVVLGLLLVAGVLLNTVLFEPFVRWGLARAREKTGVEVRFESATGSLLAGTLNLKGVTVKRDDPSRSRIDLTCGEVEADVDMFRLFGDPVRLPQLRLADVEGSYQRSPLKQPRRNFEIDDFILERATLTLREPDGDAPAPALPLTVERLDCRPLRRDTALFDLLFRSNGRGTIAGAPFEIASGASGEGRRTTWKAQGIPVGFLGGYVGEPFDWLTRGTVDMDVVDYWSDGPRTEILSHWKLDFHDVAAEVPPRVTGFKRAIAEPVTAFLRAHPAHLPLEFRLVLEKGHFTGAASLETSGLIQAAVDGLVEELARRAKVPGETIRELSRRALDEFRKFVEKRSKR